MSFLLSSKHARSFRAPLPRLQSFCRFAKRQKRGLHVARRGAPRGEDRARPRSTRPRRDPGREGPRFFAFWGGYAGPGVLQIMKFTRLILQNYPAGQKVTPKASPRPGPTPPGYPLQSCSSVLSFFESALYFHHFVDTLDSITL